MTIPVYRQNTDYDDWEVASVYDSDDSDSLGQSGSYESSHCSSSQLHDPLYEETRPRADCIVAYPQSQQQHPNYLPVALTRSRWDTCLVPGKQNNLALPPAPIVPPPGVIFPPKDWVHPPQDMYPPCTTGHVASSGMPVNMALMEPPPSSLLLSPSSPPRAPSPLIRRPSPTRTIAHSQAPHATSITVSSTGMGLNANTHAPPNMPPYHELVHTTSPRLAEAGCQAHSGMAMISRRSRPHDVLLSHGPEASSQRGPQTGEEITVAEERCDDGGGPGGHSGYRPGDRADSHPPSGSSKYEYEHGYTYDAGWMRTTRPRMRERRPSIWQRFVRRFSPSRGVSVGHT